MHFWLQSCGDNTQCLPDLIGAGMNVFHPVQKHTMDEARMRIAAGNGIVSGTPFENIEAFLDEAVTYGSRRGAGTGTVRVNVPPAIGSG